MATIEKYQTRSGATLYRVRYRTPDQRQTDKRGFATKKAAEAFAASVEVAKLKGEYVAPSSARVTVGEFGAGMAGPPARPPQAVRLRRDGDDLAATGKAAMGRHRHRRHSPDRRTGVALRSGSGKR